nr:reverse transcriptase domain-containing protein [Tanacetum cinerariifolium]
VNDVTRLQALVYKKKVVDTEAAIREVLRLNDIECVDCLPNEEIFIELARMGYEKPSTKLTFYKAFFLSQWKFLIHIILLSMSAKRTLWNEFSSAMVSAVICLSTGDLSTYTTKYASPTLTQKVFANIRRVGKGFSGVETPLFEGMLVRQEIEEEGDADEHVEDVTAGNDAQGNDTAAHGEVPTVQQTPPQSPQVQPPSPQPQAQQQAADFLMILFQEALDACTALTKRVEHLEYDKVAQALEIKKLKRRVKRLEKENKARVLKLKRLQKERMIDEIYKDNTIFLMDEKEEDKKVKETKVDESAQVQERQAESQAKIYKINMDHALKVLSMQEDEQLKCMSAIISAAEPQVPAAATITDVPAKVVASLRIRRKGVSPRLSRKSNRLRWMKNMLESLHAEINKDIEWDVAIDHVKLKAKEDLVVQRYQVMKRNPQTKGQARKNMMMYLKNVAGFKLDYFKGISYDDIRLIFEAKFNSNIKFLLKTKEQMEEEENRALKSINETPAQKAPKRGKLNKEVEDLKRHLEIMPNEDDDVYTEATPLARKVPVVDYKIIDLNNKPYYKIIRADGTHQLYISFLTLLKNFDREDLEALWSLVKERFSTSKPKSVSDDFLLTTLGAMFVKPDAQAQVWKNQMTIHGQAKIHRVRTSQGAKREGGYPGNLFRPLDNPELTIRRRSRSDTTLLNNSEMAAEGPDDLPVPDLRTVEELCQPSLNSRGGPIAPIPIQAMNFGLKNDMNQQVQNSCQFHGLSGDDANKHLDKFFHVTQSIKVNGVTDDALHLYLFSYSLTHHATAWFDRLPRNSINTFEQMAKMFLGKYFPPSMVTKLRNEITNFCQRPNESLFKAWEHYKLSIDRCPNHNMLPVT